MAYLTRRMHIAIHSVTDEYAYLAQAHEQTHSTRPSGNLFISFALVSCTHATYRSKTSVSERRTSAKYEARLTEHRKEQQNDDRPSDKRMKNVHKKK